MEIIEHIIHVITGKFYQVHFNRNQATLSIANRLDYVSRTPRIVLPGHPHHVTQRGARRQKVFFMDYDRNLYLDMLSFYCKRFDVRLVGYCLMDNHVHHLLIPDREESLSKVFHPLHRCYANEINQRHGWTGHLWQERFYSCPVEQAYLTMVARYIDCNPVRAGIVKDPVDYQWSSAQAHCGLTVNKKLNPDKVSLKLFAEEGDWHDFLLKNEDPVNIQKLEEATQRYLPYGSEQFISDLEGKLGRCLRPRAPGRPKKCT